jgi:putative endonuclease
LQLCGYRILARRWRYTAGDIDLIVKRRQKLVFVEVKYRFRADQIIMPSSTQCRRIRSAAALFLAKYPEMSDAQCRFDLLIINHGRIFGVGRIVHLKNAWQ